MTQTLVPTGSRLIATRLEAQTQTKSGILLGDKNSQEKPVIAIVVSTGPDVVSIETGDSVVYKEYSATEFKHDGGDYLIMEEDDVLALLEEVEDEEEQ